MHIGMAGLGKMGYNMMTRLVRGGHKVTAYARSAEAVKKAEATGARGAYSPGELIESLPAPRVVWLMVPAGAAVQEVIEGVAPGLTPGDIIVDGGNSFYRDSVRRADELKTSGIGFIDAGVSGGVWGLENGYCIMTGGDTKTFATIEPALKTLSAPGGYMHCGPSGAGHFVKMVHNGIEYGMMEAYAEGFELLKTSKYGGVDLEKLSRLWNTGSVVRSWLLELLEAAFHDDPNLSNIKGYVEDSGEGRWMVKEAVDASVPLPVITEALFRRFSSRRDDSFAEKTLAALRHRFGGHDVRPKD